MQTERDTPLTSAYASPRAEVVEVADSARCELSGAGSPGEPGLSDETGGGDHF